MRFVIFALIGVVLGPAVWRAIDNARDGAGVAPFVQEGVDAGLGGDLDRSAAMLGEAARREPQNALTLALQGTALRKRGDYAAAIRTLDKAITLAPELADAYCQRAFAYQQQDREGNADAAFRDADRAIALDPESALAHLVRGQALYYQGHNDLAIADYTRTIKLNPSSYSAYANRALVHADRGDMERAKHDLGRALELDPPADEHAMIREFYEAL